MMATKRLQISKSPTMRKSIRQIPPGFDKPRVQKTGTLGSLDKIVTHHSLLDSSSYRECFVTGPVTKNQVQPTRPFRPPTGPSRTKSDFRQKPT